MNIYRRIRNIMWRISMKGFQSGPHITRYYMYERLRSVASKLNPKGGNVLSDQVLEHIEGNPQKAVSESFRVLRPGGVAVHTTCFMNPVHGVPKDFWRFTPDALQWLHSEWSEIIEVGGWGNEQVWSIVRDGLRYAGIPHARWHPLHRLAVKNDPKWPIVTWVIAMK